MSLYREYLSLMKKSEKMDYLESKRTNSPVIKSRKEKVKSIVNQEILKNAPPLYDHEISRRLSVPTLPDDNMQNVLLMSVQMGSLGAPFMSMNGKNRKVIYFDNL